MKKVRLLIIAKNQIKIAKVHYLFTIYEESPVCFLSLMFGSSASIVL